MTLNERAALIAGLHEKQSLAPHELEGLVFAALVAAVAEEREQCAVVAQSWRRNFIDHFTNLEKELAADIADAIRARATP